MAENSAQGTAVGQAHATDVDGNALTYSLTAGNADWDGDDRPAFALDAKTGALSVNDPGDLDFEAHPAFALQVTATDPGGLSGSATVTVKLSDLNEILGTPGPDLLRGTSGRDWLDGGAGDDRFIGGGGNDTFLGGEGSDRADYTNCLVPIKADLATGTATGQGMDTLASIENLTGGIAGDTLLGDANPNAFWGGPGDDNLEGNAGDDRLGGGLGNDRIQGGDGSDLLYGCWGQDTLTGGAGADSFVYKAAQDTGNTATTRDVVADFSSADGDKLDVRLWDAKPSVAGLQHWSFVVGFTGVPAQVSFDAASHLVLFDQDGDKQADFQVELTGVAALSSTDFVLA